MSSDTEISQHNEQNTCTLLHWILSDYIGTSIRGHTKYVTHCNCLLTSPSSIVALFDGIYRWEYAIAIPFFWMTDPFACCVPSTNEFWLKSMSTLTNTGTCAYIAPTQATPRFPTELVSFAGNTQGKHKLLTIWATTLQYTHISLWSHEGNDSLMPLFGSLATNVHDSKQSKHVQGERLSHELQVRKLQKRRVGFIVHVRDRLGLSR